MLNLIVDSLIAYNLLNIILQKLQLINITQNCMRLMKKKQL